jgi:hypothetical protein
LIRGPAIRSPNLCTCIVSGASSSQSVHWSGRCRVRELPNCISDPQPHRRAIVIALLGKLFRPYRTFYVSLTAIALEYQVSNAPDIDLRDHTRAPQS